MDESTSRSKKWRRRLPLSRRAVSKSVGSPTRRDKSERRETPVDRIIAWNERRANQLTFRRNRKVARGKRERKEERRRGLRDGEGVERGAWREGKRKRLKRRGTADVNEKLLPLMDSPRGHRDLRG